MGRTSPLSRSEGSSGGVLQGPEWLAPRIRHSGWMCQVEWLSKGPRAPLSGCPVTHKAVPPADPAPDWVAWRGVEPRQSEL